MGFGEIVKEGWKDYKANFWANSKIILAFYILPMILSSLIIYSIFGNNIQAILGGTAALADTIKFLEIGLIVFAAGFLLNIFGQVAIISSSVKKKKYEFSEAIKGAKRFYFRYLGMIIIIVAALLFLAIVSVIIAILLLALGDKGIIVGAIIALIALAALVVFAVYLTFSTFVLADENIGIFKAFRGSYNLVRCKWPKVFGYLILIGLIMVVISIIIGVPRLISSSVIVSSIMEFISPFIVIPFGILLLKNFYLEIKKRK